MANDTLNIRRGSALIVDVVNFKKHEPFSLLATAQILDELYVMVAEAIAAYEGEVVKWLGDGALCAFWDGHHEMNAVKAALDLQRRFEQFADKHAFKDSGLTISIATGEMVSGRFGSGSACLYDVFGEPVNCTATIMPEVSGHITLCEATYKSVSQAITAQPIVAHEYYGNLYTLEELLP